VFLKNKGGDNASFHLKYPLTEAGRWLRSKESRDSSSLDQYGLGIGLGSGWLRIPLSGLLIVDTLLGKQLGKSLCPAEDRSLEGRV